LVCAVLLNIGSAKADEGFYIIAGGRPSGKALKTQVFTNYTSKNALGTSTWAKLSSPQWTYAKLSATSYLVITYQDNLQCIGGFSLYQLRVNDQPALPKGPTGEPAPLIMCNSLFSSQALNSSGCTGVWLGLPRGDVNLSIWQKQFNCTLCK
jgi:hypothetical protein